MTFGNAERHSVRTTSTSLTRYPVQRIARHPTTLSPPRLGLQCKVDIPNRSVLPMMTTVSPFDMVSTELLLLSMVRQKVVVFLNFLQLQSKPALIGISSNLDYCMRLTSFRPLLQMPDGHHMHVEFRTTPPTLGLLTPQTVCPRTYSTPQTTIRRSQPPLNINVQSPIELLVDAPAEDLPQFAEFLAAGALLMTTHLTDGAPPGRYPRLITIHRGPRRSQTRLKEAVPPTSEWLLAWNRAGRSRACVVWYVCTFVLSTHSAALAMAAGAAAHATRCVIS